MTSEFGRTANRMAVETARASLDDLMAWVGVDGLVAAIREPGLLAAIDQHSATVRDTLGEHVTDVTALAEYAREVHAAAFVDGHLLPDLDRLDWSNAPSYLLRLVAVCALAEAAGCL
ncbi:hypothetical protein HC031_18045 [Planosporangium thailandense]|uniref:Uncharacterized protein n=1 Tax=Planosporangium thailandense TaxID=765197 RepID=A0ABX0Y0K3_9ACTN|nr:DUF6401 family natural product biosynthesis protein [Planosporangium thailandense]NJC71606.1 hypothetical protein [Planosporangium thailandense]